MKHNARLARLERARRRPADDTDIPIRVVDLMMREDIESPAQPVPLTTTRRVNYRDMLYLLAPLEGGDDAP